MLATTAAGMADRDMGMPNDMKVRPVIVAAGLVALLVGFVGLVSPVSVSAGESVVGCGSALAPDLSAARAHDDAGVSNDRVSGERVIDTDYTRLCGMDLEDRRLWTITLGGVGALVLAAVATQTVWSRRTPSRR
ncbi:hypothetical protein [Mycolicibacterium frederiksbergense]|uniref:hypothetical protein n=1 Tax=Mycolicibacterium frederiksbergense TaxID=117567 RepID=UPI00265C86DD|nr:hypothetical protein [Mycolicibacterium frederiksbergense]MDO0977052.1 hypothetical protein [Mycolicibacterium frederiksbergense]